jgi:hypothetical protein
MDQRHIISLERIRRRGSESKVARTSEFNEELLDVYDGPDLGVNRRGQFLGFGRIAYADSSMEMWRRLVRLCVDVSA